MFKVKLVKNDGSKIIDITPITNKISWDSDLSLKSVTEFGINWGDARYIPYNPVEIGDLAILYANNEEVNRGIVVTEKKSGRNPISYTAYDYGWYLGKSKSVYQFNGISVVNALKKILNDFGIPIGNITSMSTVVSKTYIQKTPAEIMTDLINIHEQQTGQKIYTELRKGRIYIERMTNMETIGTFKLASNIAPNNILSNPLGAEKTRTIEDMRNQVKIILSKNDNYETVALAQDVNTGSKYGLLEEVFKIDEEDVAKARQVSKILLERLNKIHETNKISLMGDPKFKAGRIFNVYEPLTKMQGRYMITNCSHTVAGGYHVMDLVLTLPEGIA
jgi:hypothetical protein